MVIIDNKLTSHVIIVVKWTPSAVCFYYSLIIWSL